MSTERYKCLVFDWDGTLIDSIARIVTSLQAASWQICNETIGAQQARAVIGLGLREAILALHPELDEASISAYTEAYSQHFLYDNPVEADLFEGVTDMLHALQSSGFLLAVATGKSRRGLNRSLHETGLGHIFSCTRCAGEMPSKPQPDMLLAILDELGLNKHSALMIGDSEHDLQMANNASVDAVAVSHGVQQAEVLLQYQPLACLDRITDLSDFLAHNS